MRLKKFISNRNSDNIYIWALFPSRQLIPLYVDPRLLPYMFATEVLWLDVDQSMEFERSQLPHYMDIDFQIFQHSNRSIYMVHSYHNHRLPVNFTACRILMDQLQYELPNMTKIDEIGIVSHSYIPHGPVFLLQITNDTAVSYEVNQLKADWPYFFRIGMPYDQLIKEGVFTVWDEPLKWLIKLQRSPFVDHHYKERCISDFVVKYLREPYTKSLSQLDRMKCTLMGVSLKLQYDDNTDVIKWDALNNFPLNVLSYTRLNKLKI